MCVTIMAQYRPKNNDAFDADTMARPTLPGMRRQRYDTPRNTKGVCQFINDGAMLNWDAFEVEDLPTDNMEINPNGVKHMTNQLYQSQMQSDPNKHTMLLDDKTSIVATKHIKQRGALYFTHNYGYREDRLQKQTAQSPTPMFIVVAFADIKMGNHK